MIGVIYQQRCIAGFLHQTFGSGNVSLYGPWPLLGTSFVCCRVQDVEENEEENLQNFDADQTNEEGTWAKNRCASEMWAPKEERPVCHYGYGWLHIGLPPPTRGSLPTLIMELSGPKAQWQAFQVDLNTEQTSPSQHNLTWKAYSAHNSCVKGPV